MRVALFFLIIAVSCAALDVQADDCVPAKFGNVKIDVDKRKELARLPGQIKLPERGIAINSEGLFINEGLNQWLILDFDSNELSHIVFTTPSGAAAGNRYEDYEKQEIESDWVELKRTVAVSEESLLSVICKANYIWRYENQSSIEDRMFMAKNKAWKKEYERCSRVCKLNCVTAH
jgi:hypothetical protein